MTAGEELAEVANAADAPPVDDIDTGESQVAESDEPEGEQAQVPEQAPVRPTGDIRWIQQRLKDLGYYSGPVDGEAGGATRRAIREYQAEQGLSVTGEPTPALQDFMWRNDG
jgi:peptidoglycan hydrolase-like protein with peptidoglycan-binding domain